MNTDIQSILIIAVILSLALLVAYLGQKVSQQVDLKTLAPFLQEIQQKAIIEAELRARATSTPIDDMVVTAVKNALKDMNKNENVVLKTGGSTSVITATPLPHITASNTQE